MMKVLFVDNLITRNLSCNISFGLWSSCLQREPSSIFMTTGATEKSLHSHFCFYGMNNNYYYIAGITCPPLSPLINGEIKYTEPRGPPSPVPGNYLPPTLAKHKCNNGYIRKGQEYLECQDNGEWNYDSPTCERKKFVFVCVLASHELYLYIYYGNRYSKNQRHHL